MAVFLPRFCLAGGRPGARQELGRSQAAGARQEAGRSQARATQEKNTYIFLRTNIFSSGLLKKRLFVISLLLGWQERGKSHARARQKPGKSEAGARQQLGRI